MASTHEGRSWWKRKRFWVPTTIVALLVVLRIALPYVIEWKINQALASLHGYFGEVEDVDLQLWRGGVVIEGIKITKRDTQIPAPFFKAPRLEGSVQWPALLDGAIVAEATLYEPELNFVQGPSDAQSQYGRGVNWQEEITSLVPLDINKFQIVDGEIHYRDFHSNPKVNVYVQSLEMTAKNISNVVDDSEDLPAELEATGVVLGSGQLNLEAKLDLLAPSPEFNLDLELEGLALPQLNAMLKAYVGVDAESGRFSLYTEARGSEAQLTGYAKPILEKVEIHEPGESGDFLDRAGDAFVGLGLEVLENQRHERVATRVPISGSLENLQTNPWVAAFGILRNAYIDVFSHGLSLNRRNGESDR